MNICRKNLNMSKKNSQLSDLIQLNNKHLQIIANQNLQLIIPRNSVRLFPAVTSLPEPHDCAP